MRIYAMAFFVFCFSISVWAQEKTILTGTLSNCKDVEIHLRTKLFSEQSLHEVRISKFDMHQSALQAEVFGDTVFYLETEDVKRPFTPCALYLDSEIALIYLSPGDSLNIDIDYWSFKTGNVFSGSNAIINQYGNEKRNKFNESGRYKIVFAEKVENDRIEQLQSLYEDQLTFLEYWKNDQELDDHFYDLEKRFIKYQYYYGLLTSVPAWLPKEESKIQFILDELDGVDLADEEAFYISRSYRELIRSYLGFRSNPYNTAPILSFKEQLALGEKYLSGIIKSHYSWTLMYDAIYGADSRREKQSIIAHAERLNQDTLLTDRLMYEKNRLVWTKWQERFWYQSGFLGSIFLVGIFLLFLFVRYLARNVRNAAPQEVKIKPLIGIAAIISMASLVPAADLIVGHPITDIWPLLSGLLFFAVYGGFSRILFPLFWKKNYLFFTAGTLLLFCLYYIALRMIMLNYGPWSELMVAGMLRKWFVLSASYVFLIVLFVDYLVHLNEQGKSFKHFIRILSKKSELIFLGVIFLYVYFASVYVLDTITGVRNFVLSNLALVIFFLFAFWLVPVFVKRNRWLPFFLGSFLFFVLSEGIIMLTEAWFLQAKLLSRGIDAGFNMYLPGVNGFIFLTAVPGILFALVRDNLRVKAQIGYRLYRKKEAELNQLRSQVNPHFLFNSLNTVYAQALKDKNEATAESIAKLSSLMRYLIEDMDKEEIPIHKEIGYIEDYIKLQSARSAVEHTIIVKIDLSEEEQKQMIAPMLMIPFVENAFKHGVNPNKESQLDIAVSIEAGTFQFKIRNSIDPEFEAFEKERGFGIGIPNVRKRLEYIYPGAHNLSIHDTESYYRVVMEIELKKILN